MKKILAAVVLGAAVAAVPLAYAQDGALPAAGPSLQDVNNAVRAGHLAEAQAMMQTVLREHPNSAKAHFVDSEVLARMARIDEARREFERAEQLEPGLPSIRPETVQDLRLRLAGNGERMVRVAEAPTSTFPWGPVLLLVGVGVVIFLVLRARRPAVVLPASGAVVPGGSAPYGYGGYGAGGMPYGGAPMGGGGLGSGILGGLATGAAVGAGVVAGEALAHEFIGNHDHASGNAWVDDGSRVASVDNSDLGVDGNWDSAGGSDFAGGLGGGDDWS